MPNPLDELHLRLEGSSSAKNNTWHLSIIDGGQPRVAQQTSSSSRLVPASLWQQQPLLEGVWEIEREGTREVHTFGSQDGIPVSGDFNGDGTSEVGVFFKGHWYLDINANGKWDSQDLWAKLGHDGDLPVVGDWDGDGKDDIGVFGRAWPGDPRAPCAGNRTARYGKYARRCPQEYASPGRRGGAGQACDATDRAGHLRTDVIDHVFLYGDPGDYGVVGDWNGDGIDTVGIFRNGVWLLDVDGNGRWTDPDEQLQFGQARDIPLVGDFNGDGIDDLAVVRDGKIIIDANRNRKFDSDDRVIHFDPADGTPVVGKWNGAAADGLAWYRTKDTPSVTVANRENSK